MNKGLTLTVMIAIGVLLGCSSDRFTASSPNGSLDTQTFSSVTLTVDGNPVETSLTLPAGSKVDLRYELTFVKPRTPEEILRLKSMPFVEVSLQSGANAEKVVRVGMAVATSTSASDFVFSCHLDVPHGKGTLLFEAAIMEVEETTTNGKVAFRPKGHTPFHRVDVSLK